MNYYERHLGDYARDTAHLTMLEHGAYGLLLDRYYATEAPIPAEQAHRLARARSREERAAVDAVLAEFFTLEAGAWTNNRASREVTKARAKIEAARTNGRSGGRPKSNPDQTQRKPSGLLPGSETRTQIKALQTPDTIKDKPPLTSFVAPLVADGPSPDGSGHNRVQDRAQGPQDRAQGQPEVKTSKDERGKRLPNDWLLPRAWGEWAIGKYPHWTPEIVRDVALAFRNHWTAKAGKDAAKLAWDRTWQNWCMNAPTQRQYPPPAAKAVATETSFTRDRKSQVSAWMGSAVTRRNDAAIEIEDAHAPVERIG